MRVGEICSRQVFAVGVGEPLSNVARQMHERNIGCCVVVDANDGTQRPTGIITDRDLLRGQFDRKADLFCLNAGDVMSQHPLIVHERCEVSDAIELMSGRVVRRAPVVNSEGGLVGLVSFDDLLPVLAAEMTAIARLISAQVSRERSQQP